MKGLHILAIDTSGKTASVAVTDGEKLLWEKTVYTKLTHSQVILPMVSEALRELELDYPDIDCVAAAKGPGSFSAAVSVSAEGSVGTGVIYSGAGTVLV